MHPLMTAHIQLFKLSDMEIRSWSPYWPVWRDQIVAQQEFIAEFPAYAI